MMKGYNYYTEPIEDIYNELNSSLRGLTEKEAFLRLEKYGRNALLEDKKFSTLTLFLRQFKNPLVYILFFAMGLSFLTGHLSDGVIIAVVIVVTNIVGFLQEFKANKALNELNSTIEFKSKVLRQNKLEIIHQEEMVIGDIIEICAGDIVPADARLIEVNDLKVSEASLTGESYPSKKFVGALLIDISLADRDNMVYQGTAVNEGTARAIVVATGVNTEMGKIASMIKETEEMTTPLQRQINKFGKWLGVFLIGITFSIFIIGILMGRPFFDMLMVAVVIVVSAVPEGLIPAMSIILALGMQKLIKKKGLVRKVVSAETLGSVSIICTDKTGTLTEGKMNVDSIMTATQNVAIGSLTNKKSFDNSVITALKIGVLSNNAIMDDEKGKEEICVTGNVTEQALLLAGLQYGFSRENLELEEHRVAELPFSSVNKMMATLHKDTGNSGVLYVKGAPEKIFSLCTQILHNNDELPINETELKKFNDKINKLTERGQRVLAVAYKKSGSIKRNKISIDDVNQLVLVGIYAIKDKIRADAKEAIELCKKAGVKVAMITGDHVKTAVTIAKELGLEITAKNVLEGVQIDKLSEEELKKRVVNTVVYARVEPKHKLTIVKLLQESGEVVAMTGDGINDAPALKKADIGVVMGNGTDVAKQVADLVLLDSRFMTIVEAIRQGRTTFSNIRKVIVYLFTDSFQELVIIGTAVLAGWPLPITPVQILWIKLIESPLPATSLSFEQTEVDVMKDKPRRRHEQLLTGGLKVNIAFYAIVMDIFAILLFYYNWKVGGDLEKARTITFVSLGMSTLFLIYSVRVLRKSAFKTNPFKNKLLVIATIIGFILFLVAVYSSYMNKILETTPLGIKDWLMIFSYVSLAIIVFEIGKKLTTLRERKI